VDPGTYIGAGNKNLDLGGKAITVRSVNPNDPCVVAATVIDCEGSGRGFYFHSGEGPGSVISGLTITRAKVTGRPAKGGAIYCTGACPTIKNCLITSNQALGSYGDPHGENAYGGGIYCESNSCLTLIDCTVSSNRAKGGAGDDLWCSPMSGCTGGMGSGGNGYGGGVYSSSDSSLTIVGCMITDNSVLGGRGGVYLDVGQPYEGANGGTASGGGIYSDSAATIINNCSIVGNTTTGGDGDAPDDYPLFQAGQAGGGLGGGVCGEFTITNSTISGNHASIGSGEVLVPISGGGAICCMGSSSITNCLITDNSIKAFFGTGISVLYSGNNSLIKNCTIAHNAPDDGYHAVDCDSEYPAAATITDSVIWGHNGLDVSPGCSVTYSCLEQDVADTGNIHSDPCFVDAAGGDYHLSALSPCINAGDPDYSPGPGETDIDGEARVMCARVDMGADEFTCAPRPISLDYDAEAYAYAYANGESQERQLISHNDKAEVSVEASEWICVDGGFQGLDSCGYQLSATSARVEGIHDYNGARIISTLKGRGEWDFWEEGGYSASGTGGGDGNGYTSLAGTIGIAIFEGYPRGSAGLTLRVGATIVGGPPGAWDGWDWWLKIWDDDPDNPLVLLNDGSMSADLEVVAGQVLRVEFYHEARQTGWPEAGLENTVTIGLEVLFGNPADIDEDGDVDLVDFALLAADWYGGRLMTIPEGRAVVDGMLGEWLSGVQWRPLDKVYYGNPEDVTGASFALRWDPETNKIYAAVVAEDSDHVFLDEYVKWDASDRLEIYSQGDAEGGSGWPGKYNTAQQYYVAPDTFGGSWATWAWGETVGEDAGFEYAVSINDNQIIYEAGVTAFDNYGGLTGEDTVVTSLSPGTVVGFDVVVDTRRGEDGFGMLSENTMTGKYNDADRFARYFLVGRTESDLDGNGVVDFGDLDILAERWLTCYVSPARGPSPADSQVGVGVGCVLAWSPGNAGLYHDVYFGMDAEAVGSADHSSAEYRGRQDANFYEPCGLEYSTTYYWRVDEVGGACVAEGQVWSFTTMPDPDLFLIGWWKFDEGSGTTAFDWAGDNDGTIYGAQWVTGQIGGALSFDGNDGVYLEGSSGFDSPLNIYNADLTISSWVKIGDTGGTIVARAQPYYIAYRLGISEGKAYINTYKWGPRHWVLIMDEMLDQDTWYHIAGVFDRARDRGCVYVDGIRQAQGAMVTDPLSNVAATKIGCRNHKGDQAFNGLIDDVRIYKFALPSEEIERIYQEGLN